MFPFDWKFDDAVTQLSAWALQVVLRVCIGVLAVVVTWAACYWLIDTLLGIE